MNNLGKESAKFNIYIFNHKLQWVKIHAYKL